MVKSIALLLPLLFLIELVLGGPGYWRISTSFTLRKALFALSICSLYLYGFSWKRWILSKIDLTVLVFLIVSVLVWVVILPAKSGISLRMAFSDGGALLMLLIYFPLAHLLRTGAIRWKYIRDIFMGLVLMVAAAQVFLWVTVYLFPDLAGFIRFYSRKFFMVGDHNPIKVGPMPDGFYRVMWISSLYMIPVLFWLLKSPTSKIFKTFAIGLSLMAVYVAYTRAIWLGIAIGLTLLFAIQLFMKFVRGRFPLPIFFSFVSILLIPALAAIVYLKSDQIIARFDRMLSLVSGDAGVSLRLMQLQALIDTWTQRPLLGSGFGAYTEGFIRSQTAPFSYEMVPAALLMKLGLIGVIFWVLTGFILAFYAHKSLKRTSSEKQLIHWFACWVAFLIPCMTNPFLFNFVGMSIVVLLLLEIAAEEVKFFQIQPNATLARVG